MPEEINPSEGREVISYNFVVSRFFKIRRSCFFLGGEKHLTMDFPFTTHDYSIRLLFSSNMK